MRRIVVELQKVDVWEEVAKLTDYMGSKRLGGEDDGVRDRLLLTDADSEAFERQWREGLLEMVECMREWRPEVGVCRGGVSVSLVVADGWPGYLRDDVVVAMRGWLADLLLVKWLLVLSAGDDVKRWSAEAEGKRGMVMRLLHTRDRGERCCGHAKCRPNRRARDGQCSDVELDINGNSDEL